MRLSQNNQRQHLLLLSGDNEYRPSSSQQWKNFNNTKRMTIGSSKPKKIKHRRINSKTFAARESQPLRGTSKDTMDDDDVMIKLPQQYYNSSQNAMDFRRSDFDALQDQYITPQIFMNFLAIDATSRRNYLKSHAHYGESHNFEFSDEDEDNLGYSNFNFSLDFEFQKTVNVNECDYHCRVTQICDLDAIESHQIFSQNYNGFIILVNNQNDPQTYTNLFNHLTGKPKIFVFLKEARRNTQTKRRSKKSFIKNSQKKQQTKNSLTRKIGKYFKKKFHCPFIQTSSYQKSRVNILMKLIQQVEKIENKILNEKVPCFQKFIQFFLSKDEIGTYIVASILRIFIIFHMVLCTLSLFYALNLINQMTDLYVTAVDGNPLIIFTSLFSFFGFLISSIAYYGLQRMSKQYLKLFVFGTILSLLWAMAAILDSFFHFFQKKIHHHNDEEVQIFETVNIFVLTIATLLTLQQIKRYNLLKQAKQNIALERILVNKDFRLSNSFMNSSSQHSSDDEKMHSQNTLSSFEFKELPQSAEYEPQKKKPQPKSSSSSGEKYARTFGVGRSILDD